MSRSQPNLNISGKKVGVIPKSIPNPKLDLGHFCDPERNHFKADGWPWHEACRGLEIINFGLEDEQTVDCECQCHNKEKKK